jgi:hypothetical protein
MIAWIKALFLDESRFDRFLRSGIAFTAILLPTLDGVPEWVKAVGVAAALFIPAGEKNAQR